ncbi:MAG: hypothetical protein AB7U35_04955 [Sphingobium sp.]
MDAAAPVDICPEAYEVFSTASKISALEALAKDRKWKISKVTIEGNDVGRFTLFIDENEFRKSIESDQSSDFFGTIKKMDGHFQSSGSIPEGSNCHKMKSSYEIIGENAPKVIFIESSAEFSSRLERDAQDIRIEFMKFRNKNGNVVLKFSPLNGLNDYKMESISYRFLRGDYGNAMLGIAFSQAEMIKRNEAKWGPSE